MRETIIGDNVEITHERHSGYVDEIASMMRNSQVSELAIPMNEFIEQIIISSYKDEYKRLCNAVLVFISEDTVKHEAIQEGGLFIPTTAVATAASDAAKVTAAGATEAATKAATEAAGAAEAPVEPGATEPVEPEAPVAPAARVEAASKVEAAAPGAEAPVEPGATEPVEPGAPVAPAGAATKATGAATGAKVEAAAPGAEAPGGPATTEVDLTAKDSATEATTGPVAPAPLSGSDTGPLGFNIINHLNEIKKKKSIIIPYKNKIVLEKYFTPPREQYDLYKLYISFYIINYQYI